MFQHHLINFSNPQNFFISFLGHQILFIFFSLFLVYSAQFFEWIFSKTLFRHQKRSLLIMGEINAVLDFIDFSPFLTHYWLSFKASLVRIILSDWSILRKNFNRNCKKIELFLREILKNFIFLNYEFQF